MPTPTPMNVGVIRTLEVRVPISPRHAILITWNDDADDVAGVVRGGRDHAGNLNAFTIAQAEKEWCHQPGAQTTEAAGKLVRDESGSSVRPRKADLPGSS